MPLCRKKTHKGVMANEALARMFCCLLLSSTLALKSMKGSHLIVFCFTFLSGSLACYSTAFGLYEGASKAYT